MMNQRWQLTQKQFDWLVDIIDLPYPIPKAIRARAVGLLKRYGLQGWYDVDGKMSLNLLGELVREARRIPKDDLPFTKLLDSFLNK